MKTIEIIVHCWAEKYPHYAAALRYLLSSLVLHGPKTVDVCVTVCYCPTDVKTDEVVEEFARRIRIFVCSLPIEKLGRRSIGRNIAAIRTKTDIVWFADVDHVFGHGCLDALAAIDWSTDTSMVYPRHVLICKDHATGDRLLCEVEGTIDIDPSQFVPKRYGTAIGGVQIVRGDFAHKYGYLQDCEKWQRPRSDGRPFGDFRDDIAYRKVCKKHGRIKGIELPNLYRLRHSETTYQ